MTTITTSDFCCRICCQNGIVPLGKRMLKRIRHTMCKVGLAGWSWLALAVLGYGNFKTGLDCLGWLLSWLLVWLLSLRHILYHYRIVWWCKSILWWKFTVRRKQGLKIQILFGHYKDVQKLEEAEAPDNLHAEAKLSYMAKTEIQIYVGRYSSHSAIPSYCCTIVQQCSAKGRK